MRNWQHDGPIEVAKAVAHLPDDATIADRKKALRAAAYDFHGGTSWGQKVWSKHCKIYLARFGPVAPQKPFQFGDDIIFPFRDAPNPHQEDTTHDTD